MMKRPVLVFGLLSGVVSSLMMLLTVAFMDRIGFDYMMFVGYTAIVMSFLFVFFGIRSYRGSVGGTLTFGRGFIAGILMTLISCVFYVATWQVVYFKLAPGFMDEYATYAVEKKRASGAGEHEVAETARQMQSFKAMYDKPWLNAALAFFEPFPVGLIVTVVSAAVLRRKTPPAGSSSPAAQAQEI